MATNGAKLKPILGENNPSTSNDQKRGRNDKWGAKMKEKLKAALSQEVIQSHENKSNALKSKNTPNEKAKKTISSTKASNGEQLDQKSRQNNDRTRKNSTADQQTNGKHLNGSSNNAKKKETNKREDKTGNKTKNSSIKTEKSAKIATKSQTTFKSQTNGINPKKENNRKKKDSFSDVQEKTINLPNQKSFDKKAKETKTVTKKKSGTANTFKSTDNKKRKIPDVGSAAGLKRAKLSSGFVENNVADIAETQRINREPKAKKTNLGHSKQTNSLESALEPPSVIVHNIPNLMCSSDSDADSEIDSYIDKFFDDQQFDDMGEEDTSGGDVSEEDPSEDDTSDESEADRCDTDVVLYNEGSDDMDDGHGVDDSSDDSNSNGDSNGNSDEDSDSSAEFGRVSGSDEGGEEEEGEEEEEISDDGWEYSSDSMSHEGDSNASHDDCGSDCDSYGSLGSEVSSDDDYSYFQHGTSGNYDSTEDSDYADSNYDDMRIASGTATTYKFPDKQFNVFDSSDSQIMELPHTDSEDEECPQLIPLNVDRKKFLANEAKKAALKEKHAIKSTNPPTPNDSDHEKQLRAYYNMDNAGKTSSKSEKQATYPATLSCSAKRVKTNPIVLNLDEDEDGIQDDDDCVSFPKIERHSCTITSASNDSSRKGKSGAAQIQKATRKQIQLGPSANNSNDRISDSDQSINGDFNETADAVLTSSEIDEDAMNEVCVTQKSIQPAQVQKIRPKFFNAINSRHVLLLLHQTIYFHGNLKIKLLAGSAQIFGYQLQQNKTVTVHSPLGYGLIFIEPIPSKKGHSNFESLKSLSSDFFSHDIVSIQDEFDRESGAVLLLERDMDNKGVLMIDRYMRETMLPNINAFNNDTDFYSSEFVLHSKFLSRPKRGLTLSDQWSSVALHKNSKLIAIGGKGVGKSTFVRYTINSNLAKFSKFVFIDLDIGQPECFVPQTLGVQVITEPILGPGFLRNIKPLKSVFYGDINVLPDPVKYLECVLEIYGFCASNAELRGIPWIINTMGYNRGFGNELIACILKMFQPTDVVQIQSKDTSQNFDSILTAQFVNAWKFHIFNAEMKGIQRQCNFKSYLFDAFVGNQQKSKSKPDMTSADHRYAMVLAKLGSCLKSNSDWLSSVRPFEVSLNDLKIVLPNNSNAVDQSDYLDVLNGSLVYLCNQQNDKKSIDCYGIGIVRSVDKTTEKLYVVATIPLAEMSAVNALAIGGIALPSAILLNQHNHIRGMVPYVYNSDNFIGSKQVVHHQFRSTGNPKRKAQLN